MPRNVRQSSITDMKARSTDKFGSAQVIQAEPSTIELPYSVGATFEGYTSIGLFTSQMIYRNAKP